MDGTGEEAFNEGFESHATIETRMRTPTDPRQTSRQERSRSHPSPRLFVRQLLDPGAVEAAQALLYRTYVECEGWTPPPRNPSGLRVAERSGSRMLVDDFSTSATWYGLFNGTALVGCYRALDRSSPLGLELARYVDLPQDLVEPPAVRELNRFTLRSDFEGDLFAALEVIRHAVQTAVVGSVGMVATGRRGLQRLMARVGIPETGLSIRYDESDLTLSRLFALRSREERVGVVEACDALLDRMIRRR